MPEIPSIPQSGPEAPSFSQAPVVELSTGATGLAMQLRDSLASTLAQGRQQILFSRGLSEDNRATITTHEEDLRTESEVVLEGLQTLDRTIDVFGQSLVGHKVRRYLLSSTPITPEILPEIETSMEIPETVKRQILESQGQAISPQQRTQLAISGYFPHASEDLQFALIDMVGQFEEIDILRFVLHQLHFSGLQNEANAIGKQILGAIQRVGRAMQEEGIEPWRPANQSAPDDSPVQQPLPDISPLPAPEAHHKEHELRTVELLSDVADKLHIHNPVIRNLLIARQIPQELADLSPEEVIIQMREMMEKLTDFREPQLTTRAEWQIAHQLSSRQENSLLERILTGPDSEENAQLRTQLLVDEGISGLRSGTGTYIYFQDGVEPRAFSTLVQNLVSEYEKNQRDTRPGEDNSMELQEKRQALRKLLGSAVNAEITPQDRLVVLHATGQTIQGINIVLARLAPFAQRDLQTILEFYSSQDVSLVDFNGARARVAANDEIDEELRQLVDPSIDHPLDIDYPYGQELTVEVMDFVLRDLAHKVWGEDADSNLYGLAGYVLAHEDHEVASLVYTVRTAKLHSESFEYMVLSKLAQENAKEQDRSLQKIDELVRQLEGGLERTLSEKLDRWLPLGKQLVFTEYDLTRQDGTVAREGIFHVLPPEGLATQRVETEGFDPVTYFQSRSSIPITSATIADAGFIKRSTIGSTTMLTITDMGGREAYSTGTNLSSARAETEVQIALQVLRYLGQPAQERTDIGRAVRNGILLIKRDISLPQERATISTPEVNTPEIAPTPQENLAAFIAEISRMVAEYQDVDSRKVPESVLNSLDGRSEVVETLVDTLGLFPPSESGRMARAYFVTGTLQPQENWQVLQEATDIPQEVAEHIISASRIHVEFGSKASFEDPDTRINALNRLYFPGVPEVGIDTISLNILLQQLDYAHEYHQAAQRYFQRRGELSLADREADVTKRIRILTVRLAENILQNGSVLPATLQLHPVDVVAQAEAEIQRIVASKEVEDDGGEQFTIRRRKKPALPIQEAPAVVGSDTDEEEHIPTGAESAQEIVNTLPLRLSLPVESGAQGERFMNPLEVVVLVRSAIPTLKDEGRFDSFVGEFGTRGALDLLHRQRSSGFIPLSPENLSIALLNTYLAQLAFAVETYGDRSSQAEQYLREIRERTRGKSGLAEYITVATQVFNGAVI